MPYSSVSDIPQSVKDRVKKPKKRRQWLHVWNSVYDQYHDESRAFAAANSAMNKAAGASDMDTDFNFFLPLDKIDKQTRTVSGYASTSCVDLDGEIISQEAIKAALPDYWQWRNIREMHKPSAVGVAKEANLDERGLFVTAKIVDDAAWQKIEEGVYKGFSIGGRKLAKLGNTVTKLSLVEISIVDRPCNSECSFAVNKAAAPAAPAHLLPVNADNISTDGPEREPDNDSDDAAIVAAGESIDPRTIKKQDKKAKKLAKQAKKGNSAPPLPSAAPGVDGGSAAVLGKVECGHELDLEKLSLTDSIPLSEGDMRLGGGSINTDKTISLKFKKRKDSKVTDTNNYALGKALAQFLGQAANHKANPVLALIKASEADVKKVKDPRKEAEAAVEKLFDMHKATLAEMQKDAKTPGTVIGKTIDHGEAIKLLQKVYESLQGIKTVAKSARDNLAKAARVSGQGTVEDSVSGVYSPPDGLTLISPDEMDNLPANKAAGAGMITKEHAEALAKAAKYEAEAELLKSMPAGPVHGRRPSAFDLSKLSGGSATDDSLLKDINPGDLQSSDQNIREAAIAKVIGNRIIGQKGQTVFDPRFKGTAGIGTAA